MSRTLSQAARQAIYEQVDFPVDYLKGCIVTAEINISETAGDTSKGRPAGKVFSGFIEVDMVFDLPENFQAVIQFHRPLESDPRCVAEYIDAGFVSIAQILDRDMGLAVDGCLDFTADCV